MKSSQTKHKLDDAATSIKRYQRIVLKDTRTISNEGVPKVVLSDLSKFSYVVSSDCSVWYKNSDHFIRIKESKVNFQN